MYRFQGLYTVTLIQYEVLPRTPVRRSYSMCCQGAEDVVSRWDWTPYISAVALCLNVALCTAVLWLAALAPRRRCVGDCKGAGNAN